MKDRDLWKVLSSTPKGAEIDCMDYCFILAPYVMPKLTVDRGRTVSSGCCPTGLV